MTKSVSTADPDPFCRQSWIRKSESGFAFPIPKPINCSSIRNRILNKSMVLIQDGNSEIGAHVRGNL